LFRYVQNTRVIKKTRLFGSVETGGDYYRLSATHTVWHS
jgi:hypothetical protein